VALVGTDPSPDERPSSQPSTSLSSDEDAVFEVEESLSEDGDSPAFDPETG
jgi:hypothetical protein